MVECHRCGDRDFGPWLQRTVYLDNMKQETICLCERCDDLLTACSLVMGLKRKIQKAFPVGQGMCNGCRGSHKRVSPVDILRKMFPGAEISELTEEEIQESIERMKGVGERTLH